MTKNRLLDKAVNSFWLSLSVLILTVSLGNTAQSKSTKPATIDAVIIRGASVGEGASGKKNGAVLMTRPEDINRYKALFLNNYQFMHACGYNYDVEFWSGSRLEETISYNMDCGLEEFKRDSETIAALMQSIDRQFQAGTVETIHFLKVPVTQDPTTLIRQMKQGGLHVFPFAGLNSRYPSLELTFTYSGKDTDAFQKTAQAKSQQFLAHWPAKMPQPVEYTQPVFNGGGYSSGQAEIAFRSTVWFALETDLNAVAAVIGADHIEVSRMHTPEFYPLALIRPETDKEVISALLKPYQGIELFWRGER